jgi:hypothetical protein
MNQGFFLITLKSGTQARWQNENFPAKQVPCVKTIMQQEPKEEFCLA